MGSNSLLWGEGLFLRPHHFQRMESQFHESLKLAESWATPNCYGIHRIQIEPDALENKFYAPGRGVRARDQTRFGRASGTDLGGEKLASQPGRHSALFADFVFPKPSSNLNRRFELGDFGLAQPLELQPIS